jgi:MOSC domain-containing protein YiiM
VRRAFLDGAYARVSEERYPGWSRVYARVLAPGTIAPGDRVERLARAEAPAGVPAAADSEGDP